MRSITTMETYEIRCGQFQPWTCEALGYDGAVRHFCIFLREEYSGSAHLGILTVVHKKGTDAGQDIVYSTVKEAAKWDVPIEWSNGCWT